MEIKTLYNDIEPYVAEWYKNMHPDASVWLGSISEIPAEVASAYDRCHFFAGIGGWSYALQLAGWPEDRVVWTGSCPCQPFSVAGNQLGEEDERHLWPEFLRLIAECRPPTIFGEQVASKLGREWLDGVRSDLEALGYAFAAADLSAAGVGAPIRRQRLYWVAQSRSARLEGLSRPVDSRDESRRQSPAPSGSASTSGEALSGASGVDAVHVVRRLPLHDTWEPRSGLRVSTSGRVGANALSPWNEYESLPCRDGWRRVEPGTFPMAYGVPARVGGLKAYGNSIVPPLAAAFIKSFLEAECDLWAN